MIDDNIRLQIKGTLIHKSIILNSANKMFDYLVDNNQEKLAMELIERIIVHDNSKFTSEELYGLAKIKNKKALTDPNVLLSEEQQKLVELHWKNNRHHPEYFDDVSQMEEIDIIEMCCDWHARSVQYNTDLLEFAKIRQENRFHFPEDMYKKILKYCNVLLSQDQ